MRKGRGVDGLGTDVSQWGPGAKPQRDLGNDVPQKLKLIC